jgi:hypothetical protein
MFLKIAMEQNHSYIVVGESAEQAISTSCFRFCTVLGFVEYALL